MIGNMSESQIDQLLHTQTVGRLGCHANGKTYVVPTTYAFDGEFIYCHSGEGEKIRMMRANPRVCFEVEQIVNLANWQSAVLQGEFEELEGEEASRAMGLLIDRLAPQIASESSAPPTWNGSGGGSTEHHGEKGHGLAYRIKVTEKSGRYEKR